MNWKFRMANGLEATLRWVEDVPDVKESCRKACIDQTLHQEYAVITVHVGGEQIHLVQYANAADRTLAKRLMRRWKSDASAPRSAHWAVYRNEAHCPVFGVGRLLIDSVTQKTPPGITAMLSDTRPNSMRLH